MDQRDDIPDTRPTCFLAQPHYGAIHPLSAQRFWAQASEGGIRLLQACTGRSLLANNFNHLWCAALNMREMIEAEGGRIDYFAMLHADIAPEPAWVDKLIAILEAHKADVVSCVVPIKSPHGLTSTAIESLDPWEVERRLTMREVHQLPETFSAADCGFPDRALLVNTGCWVCDFRKPWVEEVRFSILDTIVKEDGKWIPKVYSEDWDFSRQIVARGGKVLATREVRLTHHGDNEFPNDRAWGTYEEDHMANGKKLPVFESDLDVLLVH